MLKLFFTLFLLFFIGCNSGSKEVKTPHKKSTNNILVTHKKPVKLNSYALKNIKNWIVYNELNDFLIRFEKTSPNEALSNANELKSLVQGLKKNKDITILNNAAFKSRLNVLENETLRLVDMTKIPAITSKEVNEQVAKILLIFSSVNAKINAVYHQQKIEKDIKMIDFLKIDSVSQHKPN